MHPSYGFSMCWDHLQSSQKGVSQNISVNGQRAHQSAVPKEGFLITRCVWDSCQPRSSSLRRPRRTNALRNIGGTKTSVKHIDFQAFRSESKIASTSPDRRQAISGLRSSIAPPFDELQLQD